MDWNIFFSTASQTSGAIVGIFAAFLITKIVANQTEFNKLSEKLSDFIIKSKALEHESTIRYFSWYNERIAEREIDKIDSLHNKNNEILDASEYYEKLNFSPFQSKSDIYSLIEGKITELEAIKKAEEERVRSELDRSAASIQKPTHFQNPSHLGNETTEERELIDNLMVRVTQQCNANRELLCSLKRESESSTLITISIIAVILLFFAGVIYPLSFLPLKIDHEIVLSLGAFWDTLLSLKGALLSIISLIFISLLGVFLGVNVKLKHEPEKLIELKKYCDLPAYSEYFRNYEENSRFKPCP